MSCALFKRHTNCYPIKKLINKCPNINSYFKIYEVKLTHPGSIVSLINSDIIVFNLIEESKCLGGGRLIFCKTIWKRIWRNLTGDEEARCAVSVKCLSPSGRAQTATAFNTTAPWYTPTLPKLPPPPPSFLPFPTRSRPETLREFLLFSSMPLPVNAAAQLCVCLHPLFVPLLSFYLASYTQEWPSQWRRWQCGGPQKERAPISIPSSFILFHISIHFFFRIVWHCRQSRQLGHWFLISLSSQVFIPKEKNSLTFFVKKWFSESSSSFCVRRKRPSVLL